MTAPLKIVNLGLPKSGTTTLGEALKRAGLQVADWRIDTGQSRDGQLDGRFVGELMYDGYFRHGDPLALMPEFAAFTEIDVLSDGGRKAEMVERAGGARTVPQIFIGQTHVGGFDDLAALERTGRLDPLLAD